MLNIFRLNFLFIGKVSQIQNFLLRFEDDDLKKKPNLIIEFIDVITLSGKISSRKKKICIYIYMFSKNEKITSCW